ncbi:MAG: hypothetical protein N2515_07225, partial [Deltaproteobacteria bacterium]|nr:hypothetical protein [Deltaproteobacteria bacterium]
DAISRDSSFDAPIEATDWDGGLSKEGDALDASTHYDTNDGLDSPNELEDAYVKSNLGDGDG